MWTGNASARMRGLRLAPYTVVCGFEATFVRDWRLRRDGAVLTEIPVVSVQA